MSKINKDIIVLSESEHIMLRPEMWVGSITLTDEKIPIIENNRIIEKNKQISVGMYKCFDEIFDNSFDELKRQYSKGIKKGKITVRLNTKENSIEITDNGGGFKNPSSIHSVSGKTNVETAMSQLRAGSNFKNEEIEENLIGTNGVGAAIVNVLSDYFSVETCDGNIYYKHEWKEFETTNIEINNCSNSGTTVKFILRKAVFPKLKWDYEIIKSKLIFKNFIKNETYLSNIQIELFINDTLQNLDVDFIPLENIVYEKVLPRMSMKVYAWRKFTNSATVSFVNDSMCQGIHQKIVSDEINQKLFEYEKAHYYYETLIVLNLPPKYVKFGDQNKTKFIGTRTELQNIIDFEITSKLQKKYKDTDFFYNTIDDIEKSLEKNELKKIKKNKRQNKTKISEKYFPAEQQDTLFIVEGACLEPNTQIKIVANNEIINKSIKDVNIGDIVISHNLNHQVITNKFDTNKKKVIIQLESNEDIVCSMDHRWLTFNIETEEVIWLETKFINPEKHKLIKIT